MLSTVHTLSNLTLATALRHGPGPSQLPASALPPGPLPPVVVSLPGPQTSKQWLFLRKRERRRTQPPADIGPSPTWAPAPAPVRGGSGQGLRGPLRSSGLRVAALCADCRAQGWEPGTRGEWAGCVGSVNTVCSHPSSLRPGREPPSQPTWPPAARAAAPSSLPPSIQDRSPEEPHPLSGLLEQHCNGVALCGCVSGL